jgi:redox-sensitive bicupin YhaK (pirin superfamily)
MAIAQILHGQAKDLGGGFTVRRLLPSAIRRSIGPFVFLDHFGPMTEQPGTNHDVRPHPHIGLATVTYLFEGAMMHRDSLGTEQLIEPGAINWMSAGRGIVHSERRPPHLRDQSFVNHGLQLWVALPEAKEEEDPSFKHTPAADIPQLMVGQAQVRVLLGDAFGTASPVRTASPTLYLDVWLPPGTSLSLPAMAAEMALYAVRGEAMLDDQLVAPYTLAVLEASRMVKVTSREGARFAVVGGTPLGPRHMWWNFVSTRKGRILQASEDWEAQRMGHVPNDPEFIPLPATRFTPAEPMS